MLRQILGRLLGDAATTERLARSTLDAAPDDLAAAVGVALTNVLDQRGPLGESQVLRIDGVPFAAHRSRIVRDLLRWDPASRRVLVLRHLAEMTCGEVAAVVGWREDDVRLVTATWRPDDADPRRDADAQRPLAHLDPPRSFRT